MGFCVVYTQRIMEKKHLDFIPNNKSIHDAVLTTNYA